MEERFKVVPKIEYIKSAQFLIKFRGWDETKQKDFIYNLGGKTNYYKTQDFLNKV